jgi:hypothetical protein
MARPLTLSELPGSFAVVQLPADGEIPRWALGPAAFSAVVRSASELSIVVPQGHVPTGLRSAPGWACLRLEGTFDFSETGILASLAAPLAAGGVGLFVVSTWDTDYLLVRREQLAAAREALQAAGHRVDLL